ncbi:Heat shock protein 12A [Fusarium oxysporum f. sp. albedinis]|nr:Heat shock protein 12A [Fusarium oxysporum f. sp. albedinis]
MTREDTRNGGEGDGDGKNGDRKSVKRRDSQNLMPLLSRRKVTPISLLGRERERGQEKILLTRLTPTHPSKRQCPTPNHVSKWQCPKPNHASKRQCPKPNHASKRQCPTPNHVSKWQCPKPNHASKWQCPTPNHVSKWAARPLKNVGLDMNPHQNNYSDDRITTEANQSRIPRREKAIGKCLMRRTIKIISI